LATISELELTSVVEYISKFKSTFYPKESLLIIPVFESSSSFESEISVKESFLSEISD